MPTVEASVVIPLEPDEVWHVMYGDAMSHVTKLTDTITDVREYRMREDGTPIYRMFHKQGPMTFSEVSDYYVFDPPRRAENYVKDSPIGGVYYLLLEPVPGGTRMTHRWELAANAFWIRPLLPLIRWMMQRNYDQQIPEMAERMPAVHSAIRTSEADTDG